MSVVHLSIAAENRLNWLADRLASDGAVRIPLAAEELGVSEMTIRRDLLSLEERGLARRVRGGATSVGPKSFEARHVTATRAKARIAAKLAALVPEVGTVAFDASSTVMRLVGRLAPQDLTVLTNGPETFSALQGVVGLTPLLTGGRLEPRTGSLVGPLACRAASDIQADLFVMSAAAVSPLTGAMEASLDESEVKRCTARGASLVVLAVDSSKLGTRAAAAGIDWDQIGMMVTELDAEDPRLHSYRGLAEIR